MELSKNNFSKNRFDINGISEPKGKKIGIAGYHGGFWAIIGWIAAKILHKAVPIKTTKGIYYLNCKSLANWYRRVAPVSALAGEFSKNVHDPKAVAMMIEFLKNETLWKRLNKKNKAASINYLEHNMDHRFEDVKCPKNSAIIVDNRSLHANKITEGDGSRFHFIGSQAPLKETEPLFWQWIFENDYVIFDLTTFEDQKRGVTTYYPEKINETYETGPFQITLIEKEGIRRKYQVVDTSTNSVKEATRYHCTEWKDFSEGSLGIIEQLVKIIEGCDNKRIWVHCRAGIGRTGTLITAVLLKEKIEKGEITLENLDDSLVDLIASLREKRGEGFVQTLGQFMMLQEYGRSLLN